jgi:hypothetical protein
MLNLPHPAAWHWFPRWLYSAEIGKLKHRESISSGRIERAAIHSDAGQFRHETHPEQAQVAGIASIHEQYLGARVGAERHSVVRWRSDRQDEKAAAERRGRRVPRSIRNRSVRGDILDMNNDRLVGRYQACFQFLQPGVFESSIREVRFELKRALGSQRAIFQSHPCPRNARNAIA